MQEMVEDGKRGELSGMETATINVMELGMSVLGLFCTQRHNFRILVFSSGGGVTLAAIIITFWCYWREEEPEPLTPTQISD